MSEPKYPQKPKIMGYLHWQIGNDFATYHAMKPSAEFGITSSIEPLVSAFEFESLQSKLAEAEAKVLKLKRLLLLVDDSVSKEQMNELSVKQWAEYLKDFPEDL